MPDYLTYIVEKIALENPVAGKKLRKNLKSFTDEHKQKAKEFFETYLGYLNSIDKTIDYAVECYLKMTGDMFYERIKFLETGEYPNKSFKDVEARVYSNPDKMDYHMHGLILGQFLWPDQYTRLKFFSDNLLKYAPVKRYLEVGGGHGLFVSEAVRLLGGNTEYEVLDISQSSLNIAMNLVKGENLNFILKDIFEYDEREKFDFITAGEIIEHLENPLALLKKMRGMLSDKGSIYLTTPVNAPMIDHIYLFKSVDQIKALLNKAGLRVMEDVQEYADKLPEEIAIENKIPLMYACFLKKS